MIPLSMRGAYALVACLSLWSGVMAAQVDTGGKVVYVDDGDTIVVLTSEHSQMKVRLASIDAPESSHTNKERGRVGQPFSDKSGQYLSSMVKGRQVQLHCYEKDKYERDVCDVSVGGQSVNREMVAAGLAWANQAANGRYLRDKSLVQVESDARASRKGLWQGRAPVAPWEWRKTCWTEGKCDAGL